MDKRLQIFLTSFLLILVSQASAFNTCPKCGNLEVPFPLSTDENCGDPKYRVYCNNGILQFSSSREMYYNILSINPSSNKLIINPPRIQKTECFSSDFTTEGFRIDDNSPFNISTRNTVMLFNCSSSIILSPLNCSSSSFCRQFEDQMEEGNSCKGTLCCHYLKDSSMNSRRIRVRDGGCTAYASAVDVQPGLSLVQWNYGIEIQWLPPNWLGFEGSKTGLSSCKWVNISQGYEVFC